MKYLFALVCSTLLLCGCTKSATTTKTIGLIVPLEHAAMTEIVAGFQDELAKQYHQPINVIVKNAQHDLNLQRTIIEQFIAQNVDILAPIATDPFEMTISLTKNQPIVGIAADISDQQHDAFLKKGLQVTNVLDEIDVPSQLHFIQCAMPFLKMITLVHSADNKIMPQVATAKEIAASHGFAIQDLMVQQPSDIYTISQHITKESQAIFILKDNLVVSGIETLVKQAESLNIPLISSDDGSVQGGAAFAVGVHEREVGILAADVIVKILNGQSAADIPMQKITNYQVFINTTHAEKQGIKEAILQTCAKEVGYGVEHY